MDATICCVTEAKWLASVRVLSILAYNGHWSNVSKISPKNEEIEGRMGGLGLGLGSR